MRRLALLAESPSKDRFEPGDLLRISSLHDHRLKLSYGGFTGKALVPGVTGGDDVVVVGDAHRGDAPTSVYGFSIEVLRRKGKSEDVVERGASSSSRTVRMREIAPEHGRSLGIRADATTGEWGLEQGREFDVRFRRINIPDFVREKFSQGEIDDHVNFATGLALEQFTDAVKAKYKWVGEVGLVGRSAGWLAVEDKSRGEESTEDEWDDIQRMVSEAHATLAADLESDEFWHDLSDADKDESRGNLGSEYGEPLTISRRDFGSRMSPVRDENEVEQSYEGRPLFYERRGGQQYVVFSAIGGRAGTVIVRALTGGNHRSESRGIGEREVRDIPSGVVFGTPATRTKDSPSFFPDTREEAQAAVAFLKKEGIKSAYIAKYRGNPHVVFVSWADDQKAEALLTGWEGFRPMEGTLGERAEGTSARWGGEPDPTNLEVGTRVSSGGKGGVIEKEARGVWGGTSKPHYEEVFVRFDDGKGAWIRVSHLDAQESKGSMGERATSLVGKQVRVAITHGVGGAGGHDGKVVGTKGDQLRVVMLSGPEKGVEFWLGADEVNVEHDQRAEGFDERAATRVVTPTERIAKFREIVQDKQYAKIDGALVDLFTASAVTQVYDKLSPPNQEKFASFLAPKMAAVAWKLLKEVRAEDNMVGFDEAFEGVDERADPVAMRGAATDSGTPIGSGENLYIGYYKDKKYEVYADTSFGAWDTLVKALRVPERRKGDVRVGLAQKGGVDVVHTPTEGAELREREAASLDQGAVEQYRKERAEIERQYRVQDGRIRSPGKFEGEMAYAPFYWEKGLDGMADEDDGEVFTFRVTPEEKAAFPELGKSKTVRLRERDDGFVVEV